MLTGITYLHRCIPLAFALILAMVTLSAESKTCPAYFLTQFFIDQQKILFGVWVIHADKMMRNDKGDSSVLYFLSARSPVCV